MKFFKDINYLADRCKVKTILIVIFAIINQGAMASLNANCENLIGNSEDTISSIVACLSSADNFDPNASLEITCNGKFSINTDGYNCIDGKGNEFKHCTAQDQSFCFDGKVIMDEGFSSNLNMMIALCTDYKVPKPGPPQWDFGACIKEESKDFDENGIRVEDELSCFCQDHGDGLRWTCYDVSPNEKL
ncbi:MAG: hypothetical protein ACJAS4_003247 [Bacteriovoracaceae bacterium]